MLSGILIVLIITICSSLAMPGIPQSKTDKGQPCSTLRRIAKFYGLKYATPKKNSSSLTSQWTHLSFNKGSRKLQANNTLIWLHEPLGLVRKWHPALSLIDLNTLIDPLLRPEEYLLNEGTKNIVLDPGHGGKDTGCQGKNGTKEKDLVLDIARQVRRILVNAGHRVYMTRDKDRYLTLSDRMKKAKKYKADLFVSIHLNATANRQAQGTETFILTAAGHHSTNEQKPSRKKPPAETGNRYDAPNAILGYYIHKNMIHNTPGLTTDRGLKRARFYVLRNAPAPAALIECGFLSNAKEERQFKTKKHCKKTANAIAEGIMDYINAINRAKAAQPEGE